MLRFIQSIDCRCRRFLRQPVSLQLPKIQNNIGFLDLSRSELKGREFLCLIPTHAPPVLSELQLYDVQGLTEEDMLAFLTHAAPTLRTLDLDSCSFENPNGRSPCYFIDQVMPTFISLHTLMVRHCSNTLTIASLSLKPTFIQGAFIWISEIMNYDGIVDALAQTKWENVDLKTDRSKPYPEAERIAKNREIEVILSD
jgi:hypothetical protein